MEKGKYIYTVRMPWKAPVYRKAYLRRYGTRCFLRAPAYPICTRGKIDCKGVQAAAYYVRLNQARSNEVPNEVPNEGPKSRKLSRKLGRKLGRKLSRKLQTLKKYCKHLKKTSRLR